MHNVRCCKIKPESKTTGNRFISLLICQVSVCPRNILTIEGMGTQKHEELFSLIYFSILSKMIESFCNIFMTDGQCFICAVILSQAFWTSHTVR
ncbi:hypothetical protein XELAEV_18037451mg [Xenopus laevis]|uniref:Uncharacterized protein n=1 Tax=Xenopus laevis TaxID=8355 RepID=A0A974CC58_XENLA|nr:hypothetical protein XELAEV_18037451mg [Xenopus laevis]